MSPISFHFNLDPEKPDQARAFHILSEWQRLGWDIQKIMVAALLGLQPLETAPASENHIEAVLEEVRGWLDHVGGQTLDETNKVLFQVRELLEQVRTMPLTGAIQADTPPESTHTHQKLSSEFIASLKKVRKPGISLTD